MARGEAERSAPRAWRRRMATSVLLLLVLDYIVVSSAPNSTGVAIAVVLAVAVGAVIAAIWRRNSGLEKRAAAGAKQQA